MGLRLGVGLGVGVGVGLDDGGRASDRLHVQVVTLVVPLDDAGLLKVRPTVRVRLRLRLRLRVFGLGIGLGY